MFKQEKEIVLASQSDSRKKVLDFGKIQYKIPKNIHSDEDEELFKQKVEHLPLTQYVQEISNFKALAISKNHPNQFILSGDQACVMGDEEIRKPYTKEQAIAQLTSFSGQTFELVTSLTLVKNDKIIWQFQEKPTVTFRKFSMKEAENYVNKEETEPDGFSVVGIAGACRIESPYGVHMIKQVQGNQYSVMGLPLLPLIDELYNQEIII